MEQTSQKTQICEHCEKNIKNDNFTTHYAYCVRNFIKCQECGSMYDQHLRDEHEEDFHRLAECEYCRAKLLLNQAQGHKNSCERKPKICHYCQILVPFEEFEKHVNRCSSRTCKCQICSMVVTLRNYEEHLAICVQIPLQMRQPKNQKIQQFPKRTRNIADPNYYDLMQAPRKRINVRQEKSYQDKPKSSRDIFSGQTKKPIRRSTRKQQIIEINSAQNEDSKAFLNQNIKEIIDKKNNKRGQKTVTKRQKKSAQINQEKECSKELEATSGKQQTKIRKLSSQNPHQK